jgi:hypothetical protein
MSERRNQFNIGAQHFSDEVYQFIVQLSKKKKLSAWMAKCAEDEIRRNGTPMGNPAGDQVLNELREIKALLMNSSIRYMEPALTGQAAVIQKISSEMFTQAIDEDDLNYQF